MKTKSPRYPYRHFFATPMPYKLCGMAGIVDGTMNLRDF
jgi:hypothetical protein